MNYAIKEVFQTIQGEGFNTGRIAVFIRFAGCNLWSGREQDRHKGPSCSAWCDTDFFGTDGPGGGLYDAKGLVQKILSLWPDTSDPFVVCTGGEPLLQLDQPLLEEMHRAGCYVAVETNGTVPCKCSPDWVTVSPKANTRLLLDQGDELKLVYPQEGLKPAQFDGLAFQHYFLQPLDDPDREKNTLKTVDYCLKHPKWRISLQTHKILGVP